MTSEELNAAILALDEGDFDVPGLAGTGKSVPYIGWFWRTVDFDRPIRLGRGEGGGPDVPRWAGFMENNKWDYPERRLTAEQSAELRRACEAAVVAASSDGLTELFKTIQRLYDEAPK